MEINLSKKSVILFAIAGVIVLVAAVIFFLPGGNDNATPTPVSIKTATPAQIAETMARLFHTVDYQRPSAWLDAMQPYSTETGVKIMRDVVAPALWPEFTKLKTKSEAKQVKATWKKLLGSGYSESVKMDWEMHLVEVTLDPVVAATWPGKAATFTTNVVLNKTPDGWRFSSFLSDEAAKPFANAKLASTPSK